MFQNSILFLFVKHFKNNNSIYISVSSTQTTWIKMIVFVHVRQLHSLSYKISYLPWLLSVVSIYFQVIFWTLSHGSCVKENKLDNNYLALTSTNMFRCAKTGHCLEFYWIWSKLCQSDWWNRINWRELRSKAQFKYWILPEHGKPK